MGSKIDWQSFNTRILARVAMNRLGIRVSDLEEFRRVLAQGATVDDLMTNVKQNYPKGPDDPTKELALIFQLVESGALDEDM